MPRPYPAALALIALLAAPARAQGTLHQHNHHHHPGASGADGATAPWHSAMEHGHDVGPAGATYDLRWLDAMVEHHSGALLMSEQVFNGGSPGVGALARRIWDEQADEIRAMGLWRRSWFPGAPVYPVALRPGGNPDRLEDLVPMGPDRIAAMRMLPPALDSDSPDRVTRFLEGMLQHHGGALVMAHDALARSRNATLRRVARTIIATQREEIRVLRRMLQHDGLNKPEYHRFDPLF